MLLGKNIETHISDNVFILRSLMIASLAGSRLGNFLKILKPLFYYLFLIMDLSSSVAVDIH